MTDVLTNLTNEMCSLKSEFYLSIVKYNELKINK